jgi:hypothetical protein
VKEEIAVKGEIAAKRGIRVTKVTGEIGGKEEPALRDRPGLRGHRAFLESKVPLDLRDLRDLWGLLDLRDLWGLSGLLGLRDRRDRREWLELRALLGHRVLRDRKAPPELRGFRVRPAPQDCRVLQDHRDFQVWQALRVLRGSQVHRAHRVSPECRDRRAPLVLRVRQAALGNSLPCGITRFMAAFRSWSSNISMASATS